MKAPSRPTKLNLIQPNVDFQSAEEIEPWIQRNAPGARLVKTWEVTLVRCQLDMLVTKVKVWPEICPVALTWCFESEKHIDKFNDLNGHAPLLAKWECRHCGKWHAWWTAQTDSNGGGLAGAFIISPYLRSLIDRTLSGKLVTFEQKDKPVLSREEFDRRYDAVHKARSLKAPKFQPKRKELF